MHEKEYGAVGPTGCYLQRSELKDYFKMQEDAIQPGQTVDVVVIDDLIATGRSFSRDRLSDYE